MLLSAMHSAVSLLAVVLCGTQLAVVGGLHGLVEPPELPSDWKVAQDSSQRRPATHDISLLVVVAPEEMSELQVLASQVSDPGSPEYGKYLTAAQVAALTAPRPGDVQAVRSWLEGAAKHVKLHADGVTFEATIAAEAAELLLDTEIHRIVNTETGQSAHRATKPYRIPEHLKNAVAAVFGIHGLPLPTHSKFRLADQPATVDPSVLIRTYNISGIKPSGSQKNRQAVAEFQAQFMNAADLTSFFAKFVPGASASDASVFATHGDEGHGDKVEAELDIQYIMGMSPGVKTEIFQYMGSDFCSDLKRWSSSLVGTQDIPLVHSVSYGWQGSLASIGCPAPEVTAIEADLMKLAARGITLIFASGDAGSGYVPQLPPQPKCPDSPVDRVNITWVGTPFDSIGLTTLEPEQNCCQFASMQRAKGWALLSNNSSVNQYTCQFFNNISAGEKPSANTKSGRTVPFPKPKPAQVTRLFPSWPASSPWVTAVGATRFLGDVISTGPGSEAAVSSEDHFGSGGGFSWDYDAPAYQQAAVQAYFKRVPATSLPDPAMAPYRKDGRATPDVSVIGTGYSIMQDGKVQQGVGGTSASAPVFASMISLLNEARLKAGRPPMGFLNPWIYANASHAFDDVVVGSNRIGRDGTPLPYGWNCTQGWDPVTGIGTPSFPRLLQAAMAVVGSEEFATVYV